MRLRRGGWTDPHRPALLTLALSGVVVGWWHIRGVAYAAVVATIALLPLTLAVSARAGQVPRLVTRLALRLCVAIAYTAAVMATTTNRNVDAILFCSRHIDTMAYDDRKGFLDERLGSGQPPDWLTLVAGDGSTQLHRVQPRVR